LALADQRIAAQDARIAALEARLLDPTAEDPWQRIQTSFARPEI
jgi:hypothetical protein